jgi:hypothetical protein
MAAKRSEAVQVQRNVFAATFARFRHEKPSGDRPRRGGPRKLPLFARLAPLEPAVVPGGAPDPVSVAVFAIDQVGPAAVRACASGVAVRIAAADAATAEVIRAALAETSRRRPTDRLIQVVIRAAG